MDEGSSHSVSDKFEEANVLCPVCFESLLEAERLALPGTCVHVFCLDCITAWSSYSNSCPIDRLQFDQIVVKEYVDGPILETISIKNKSWNEPGEEGIIELTNCEICNLSHDEETLLLCDGCDRAYHCACLDPPLLEVPVDDWFCETCNVSQINENATTSKRQSTRSVARTRFAERIRAEVQIAREMASDWMEETPRSSRRKRRSLLMNATPTVSLKSEEAGAVAIRRRLVRRLRLVKSRDCPGLSQYGIRSESKGVKIAQIAQLNICGSARDCTPVDQETSTSVTVKEMSKVNNQKANPNILGSILQSQDVLMLPDYRVHISTSGSIKSINNESDSSFDINKAVLGSPSKARSKNSDLSAKQNAEGNVESFECEPVSESFMTESPGNNEVCNPPSTETDLPNQIEKTPQTTDVKMEETVEKDTSIEPFLVSCRNDEHNGSQSDDSFHGLNISPFKAMRTLSNSESSSQQTNETVQNSHDTYNSDKCNLSDHLSLESAKIYGVEKESERENISEELENPASKSAEFDKISSSDSIENNSSQLDKNCEINSQKEVEKEPLKTISQAGPDIGGIQFQLKKKDYEIPKKSQNIGKTSDDSSNKITISDISKEPSAEELEKFGLPPQFNNYLNERSENSSGSEKEGYTRRNFNEFNSVKATDRNWQGSRGGYQSPRGRWGPMIDDDSGRVNRNFFDRGRGGGFRSDNREGDHFANQRNRFDPQSNPIRSSKWEPIGEKREIQPPPFEPKKEGAVNLSQALASDHVVDANSEEVKASDDQLDKTPGDAQEEKSPSRKRGHSENKSEPINPEASERPASRNRSRSKSSDSRKRRRERSSSRRKNQDSDRDSRRSRERHNKDYSRNRDSDDYRSSRHRRSRSRSRRRNDNDRYGRSDYRRHHSRGQDDDYRHKRSSYRDDHNSRRYSRHDDDRERRRQDDDFDKRSKEEAEPKVAEPEDEPESPQVDIPEPEKVSEDSKIGEKEQQCTPTKDEPNFEFVGSSGGFKEIPKPDSDEIDQMLNEAPDFGASAPFMRFPLPFDGGRPRFRGDFSPRNRFQRNPRPPAFQHRMHAPPMMNPALNAMVNQPRMSAQQQQPQQQFAQMVNPNPPQRFGPPANFQRSPGSAPTFANPAFPGTPGIPPGVPPQNFLGGRIPFPFNAQQMRGQQPFPPNFLQQFAANMGNPNAHAETLLQGNDIRHVMNPSNLNAVGFSPAMNQDGANPQANMTAALLNQIESNKLLQSISTHPASVFGTPSPQQQQLQEAANLLKDIKTTPTAVSVGSSNNTAVAATTAVSPISLATIQSNMPMINNILESQLFQHQQTNKIDPNNPLSILQQQDHKEQSSFIPDTLFTQNSSPQSVEMEDSTFVNDSIPSVVSPSNSIGKPPVVADATEDPPFLKSLTATDEKSSSQAIPFMDTKVDEPLEQEISVVKEMLKKKTSADNFADDNSASDHHSDIESSANEMQLKKKLVDRSEMQTKVAELVKGILMPHFKKRSITKDEYKDIMRKSVNKVVKRGSPDIKEEKITKLVNAYVDHYRAKRTKPSKDDDHDLF